jgi:tetratricopeptide (TPR) repeat protein
MRRTLHLPDNRLAALASLIVLVGALALYSHADARRAGVPRRCRPELAWARPTAHALEDAITVRLERAVSTLNSGSNDARLRVPTYLSDLRGTEVLLQQALLASPADGRGVLRLAAVRWELGVLDGRANEGDVISMLDLAASRAPRVATSHIELGAMLYRMGRYEEASHSLTRAITLDPRYARRVVALMQSFGVTPSAIASTLPRTPEVILALGEPFFAAGLDEEYLSLIEGSLDDAPSDLLPPYGDVCLRTRHSTQLLTRLREPISSRDVIAEPLRRIQRARAFMQLGDSLAAQHETELARAAAPDDPMILEAIGVLEVSAGHGEVGAADFRRALNALAARQASGLVRGRLYREIGQAEETAGRPELAFDAYLRAIELSAHEDIARWRLSVMEDAAGLHPPLRKKE